MNRTITRAAALKGELTVPADKSISHRAIMLGSLASGRSVVRNFLRAEDPISTMNAFRSLGIAIADNGTEVIIDGKGIRGLREAGDVIDCGNSGTTMRLISGILAGNPFFSVLTGDASLRSRPMGRIIAPLRQMGADIWARADGRHAPLAIQGGSLKPIHYTLPVASAQVKSCVLLASLAIEGCTCIVEPGNTRDHTERMLKSMGADITIGTMQISLTGGLELQPFEMTVPSDFSSAAFFIAAALLVPQSEILLRSVGVNPSRTGMLEIVRRMGATVTLENVREVSGEPVADIACAAPKLLNPVSIGANDISLAIDEFPVLCVLASQADGTTLIRGAKELRVKESDRIAAMAQGLRLMGVMIEEFEDGIAVSGKAKLRGAEIETFHDHRIAMAFSVAGLIAEGETTIRNAECVDISFPGFYERMERIVQ
ncbi:MAG TPA: 3-phosphoshikimate 1-carboxyvinyltransferase [Dissulfurispiraceae bacterium]|nr:3-phosphoshikimate 1-carboxyvinyltransferase [Dissulfurispiraceae bacterium]